MVICLERGADLHMVQLMPLPLTVSCFSKIQVGFTFLVGLTRVVPEKGPLNGCVCVLLLYIFFTCRFHISQVEVVAPYISKLCSPYAARWQRERGRHASTPSSRFHVFPGKAETLVRRGRKANYGSIAYSLGNISAKIYRNRLVCVEVIACKISVAFCIPEMKYLSAACGGSDARPRTHTVTPRRSSCCSRV